MEGGSTRAPNYKSTGGESFTLILKMRAKKEAFLRIFYVKLSLICKKMFSNNQNIR